MKTNTISFTKFGFKFLFGLITLIILINCGGAEEDTGAANNGNPGGPSSQCLTTYASFVTNNIGSFAVLTAQGGALYDKWWAALGFASGPSTDHPMWSLQSTNTRTGPDTWRCKECHGWDYKGVDGAYGSTSNSHFTGFEGVIAAQSKTPIEVFCAIREGVDVDPDHSFNEDTTNGQLSDLSILQITKFITTAPSTFEGIIDTDQVINPSTNAAFGNATSGGTLYTSAAIGCSASTCHGADGSVNIEEEGGLGAMADDNPWEVLHKIRFGHPGETRMPAFSSPAFPNSLQLNQMADIIAYAQQTLDGSGGGGGTPSPPLPGDVETISLGARLYDNWVLEKGVGAPPLDNPLWSLQSTNTRTGVDTWRCKECHGWDYKGANGAYGPNNSHYTGFGGVWDLSRDESGVVTLLNNGFFSPILGENVHIYSGLLTAEEINAVAKFVKAGTIDTSEYIASSGIIIGTLQDFNNGREQYSSKPFGIANGNCELCHGTNGLAIQGIIVGAEAVSNPWEVLHKVRFGQPGSIMPSMLEAGLTIQNSVDVVYYSQSLPTALPPAP